MPTATRIFRCRDCAGSQCSQLFWISRLTSPFHFEGLETTRSADGCDSPHSCTRLSALCRTVRTFYITSACRSDQFSERSQARTPSRSKFLALVACPCALNLIEIIVRLQPCILLVLSCRRIRSTDLQPVPKRVCALEHTVCHVQACRMAAADIKLRLLFKRFEVS